MSHTDPPSSEPPARLDAPAYERALGSLNVGVCVWELETPGDRSSLRLVACNEAAARFLGVPRDKILGKLIDEGFPGALETPLPGVFMQIAESGEGRALGEVPYGDQIVSPGVFSIHAHPQPRRRVAVEFTNVTERKAAERRAAEKTEALERALGELWSEMDLAKKIQTVLLPGEPSLSGYEVAAEMRPAATVGGDYFDAFEAGGAAWALIGDVSGHGVSAGLIMMMVQAAVRTTLTTLAAQGVVPTPSRALGLVDAAVRDSLRKIGKDQYMTINALCLRGGEVVHAGLHQDILIYRAATGRVESVDTDGVWLGVVDDVAPLLTDSSFTLGEGDALLLHTDGVVEARDGREFYGLARLAESFRREASSGASARAVVRALLDEASALKTDDDLTLLVARRRSGGGRF